MHDHSQTILGHRLIRWSYLAIGAWCLASVTSAHAQTDEPLGRQVASDPIRSKELTNRAVDRAVDNAVSFLRGRQGRDGRWLSADWEARYPNALTGFAAYTLAKAGIPASDWGLRKVTDAFRDRRKTRTVFARVCTLLMWTALEPEKHKREIDDDVRFILREHLKTGGWGDPIPIGEDQSEDKAAAVQADIATTYLALLALSEAVEVGARVHKRLWRVEEESWIAAMRSNGGWPLAERFEGGDAAGETDTGATATALASLYLILDRRHLVPFKFNGRFKARCGLEYAMSGMIRGTIAHAVRWLDQNASKRFIDTGDSATGGARHVLADSLPYACLTLSEAGRTSGAKHIGTQPWATTVSQYLVRTQRSDGSWGSVYDTCFGLLALLNARSPVLVNKLVTDRNTFWHADPRDAANLVRWINGTHGSNFSWQLLDLQRDPNAIYDAPLLIMSGHEAPTLGDQQKDIIKDFVIRGGTILTFACCARQEFTDGCRDLFVTMWPRRRLHLIDPDHPVWRMRHQVDPGDDSYALFDGLRTSVLILSQPVCCIAQQRLTAEYARLFSLVDNMAGYATYGRNPAGRVDPYIKRFEPDGASIDAKSAVTVARLRHGGDWWIGGHDLERIPKIGARHGLAIKLQSDIDAAGARKSRADVLWLTGTRFKAFRADGRVELKAFLAAGGTLIASACGGNESFDGSFQAFAKTLYGAESWRRIPHDDPLLTGSLASGASQRLDQVVFRQRFGSPPPPMPDWAMLYGVKQDDRWSVIYSPYDMSGALAELNVLDSVGYRKEDVEHIVLNMLLHASGANGNQIESQGNADTPVEPGAGKPRP